MTVKSKLLSNVALTIIGIAVIAGIGLFSIGKVKSSIEILTGKSTPLHLKMLELQQTVEKVSADFMRMEMTTEPAEVAKLSGSITGHIQRMETLNEDIRKGGAESTGVDTTVLRGIEKTVVQVASQRLKDMALFRNEISSVNSQLIRAEAGVSGMRKSISQLGSSALVAINSSQAANLQVNSSIKKLLTLQSRLKDISIIIGDLELMKNKFKIGPIRERLKYTVEITRSIEVENGDHPAIKEVKAVALDLLNRIGADDGGLVALRLEILSTPDKTETEQYASKLRDIAKPLEENSRKIFDTIDTLELQIVKDRNKVVSSLGFQNAASAVMEAGSAISVDVKEISSGVRQAVSNATALSFVMIAVSLAVAVISLFISLRIITSITRPLGHAKLITQEIADGNLTKRITLASQDEIGEICGSINNIVVHFHEVITRVAHNTQQVSSASTQLSYAAEQMASGAARVAGQADTVATASEEMAATSNEIAQNCTSAASSSQQANAAAAAGAEVVKGTVIGMNQIAKNVRESALSISNLGTKSEQIGGIVGTINDIADQTNLLALNAAIEAARAGEHGRGFAVVADEVRALAQRTTTATKEIGHLIKSVQAETRDAIKVMESGVREVERGTLEAAKSGTALEEILQQISSVTMQVNQIATAAEEQTATTDEITGNIQSISEVVQSTASSAQESAASALQLSHLAEEQQKLVGQFRL